MRHATLAAVSYTLLVAMEVCAAEELARSVPADPRFEEIEKAVLAFRTRVDCSAASLGIARDGKLLYSCGYGWRDAAHRQPTRTDDLFRIASISKPFTAALIYKLIDEGKLKPERTVWDFLALEEPPSDFDPRWKSITIEQLLNHKGGWDSKAARDPMFRMADVRATLKLDRAPRPSDVIRYMTAQPLQFDPGEKSVYSNFGYCVLGRVIERSTGKSYYDALDERILSPAGIVDVNLGHGPKKDRDPREPEYAAGEDSFDLDVMDAHGGLIASAPALCTYFGRYWIDGRARQKGERQNWVFFGSLPGTTALIRQHAGWDAVALFNGRNDKTLDKDQRALLAEIDMALKIMK